MRRGFTLIELIVVIAIIAILAAIIAPNAFKAIEKAKISKSIADIKTIKTAVFSLYVDTGRYPGSDTVTGTQAARIHLESGIFDGGVVGPSVDSNLINDDSGWNGWDGPYIESLTAKNSWGGISSLMLCDFSIASGNQQWNGIWFYFWHYCYPEGAVNCSMPDGVADRIENQLDDGNSVTGEFRSFPAGYRSYRFIKW